MGENKIYLALVPTFSHSFTHPIMFSEHLLYTTYYTRHCGRLRNESEKLILPTKDENERQTVLNALIKEQIKYCTNSENGEHSFLWENQESFLEHDASEMGLKP